MAHSAKSSSPRYQVGRFAGSWYVVDLERMKFVYGPFIRRATAEARVRKIGRRGKRNPKFPETEAHTLLIEKGFHFHQGRDFMRKPVQVYKLGSHDIHVSSNGWSDVGVSSGAGGTTLSSLETYLKYSIRGNPKMAQLALLRLPSRPAPRVNAIRARGTELQIGASGKLFIKDRKSGKVLFETYDPKAATAFEARYRAKFGTRKRRNPSQGTLIYGRVLKIFAQKTSGPYKGQQFVHTFKSGAIMVGMPDGSLRISHP